MLTCKNAAAVKALLTTDLNDAARFIVSSKNPFPTINIQLSELDI